MPIQVVRFVHTRTPEWGVVHGDSIAPLGHFDSTADFIKNGYPLAEQSTPQKAMLPLALVELLSPVTDDRQFLCQGINYASHVRESGIDPKNIGFNTIFTKAPSCLSSATAAIVRPAHVRLLDYEIELGLVMRRPMPGATAVGPGDLHHWLAGVTIVNDISARDVQLPQTQFYKGKSYRSFGPCGPFLVLLSESEWRRWPELHMQLSVNGQVRQDAYCGDMIFQPHQTLTELSALHDLRVGDLIATGTPAGCAVRAPGKLAMFVLKHFVSEARKWRLFVGKGLDNPAYLQDGDAICSTIRTDDGMLDLGAQHNIVVPA